ncbi:hypothetical protein AB1Y20_010282 [Prymnesium parvum]|uniref:Uncharacterized protein n=1 Tax=Prymnesium parvum TaxID=97485 RepID=A0AB34K7X0_PRYPA
MDPSATLGALSSYEYFDQPHADYYLVATSAPTDICEYLRRPYDWDGEVERHGVATRRSVAGEFKSIPPRDETVGSIAPWAFQKLADGEAVHRLGVAAKMDAGFDATMTLLDEQRDIQYIHRRLTHAGLTTPTRENRVRALVVVGTGMPYEAGRMVLELCTELPAMSCTYPNEKWGNVPPVEGDGRGEFGFVGWPIMCANRTGELPFHHLDELRPPGMPTHPPEADAYRRYDKRGNRLPATFDCAKNQMLRCLHKLLREDHPNVYAVICLPQLGTASTELWELVEATNGQRVEVKYVGSMRKLLISRMRWVLVWANLYRRVADEHAYRPGGHGYDAVCAHFHELACCERDASETASSESSWSSLVGTTP